MHDFMKILEDFEYFIKDSKKSMLTGSRYIDEGKCMDYILTLKSLLPQEIIEAQIILSEKDNILSEAKQNADEIVKIAQDKANQLLDNSEIIAQAEYEANQIMQSAKNEQDRIRYETMQSLYDLLTDAENKMIDVINCVRDSKTDLSDSYQQYKYNQQYSNNQYNNNK